MKLTHFRLYSLICCLLLALSTVAQDRIPKGHCEAKRNVLPGNYNFWLYTPGDYEPQGHPIPLVIFLHGASLCGHDLSKVRRYGVLDAIDRGKIVPALVLAPQNPGGAWSPSKINDLLEWTKQHYQVDTTRVYVLGMSLGGYGTMDFAGKYPSKVAAAMAFCGGCTLKDMSGLGDLPLWIIHGTADKAIPVAQSKRVVSFLQGCGKDKLLRYDWLAGGSHGILARMFYLQKTYDWLFAHSTADTPRAVDKTFDIGYPDINQTYQELKWFKGMFEND